MLKKENDVPNLIIIAGSNGSGKTTTAPALLRHSLKLIASEINNNNHRKLIVENTTLWNQLLEKYHG